MGDYPIITCTGDNNEDWPADIDLSEVVSRSLVGARVGIDIKNPSNPQDDGPIVSLWRDEESGDGLYLDIVDAAARNLAFGVPKAVMRDLFKTPGQYRGDLVIEWGEGDTAKIADVVWIVGQGFSDSDWVAA